MNKRNIHLIFLCTVFILMSYHPNGLCQPGQLFNLQESGSPTDETLSVNLCLNGNGPLTCQSFSTNLDTLSVLTPVPNHTYRAAGIKINTPGYSLAHFGINCVPNQYGYCLFSVSDISPALFAIFTPGWGTGTIIDDSYLTSVSCPTNSFCMAVDSVGNAIRYDGTSWSTPTTTGIGANGLNSVSCSSSSFCVAVGVHGKASRYNGATWTPISLSNPTVGFNAVSCVDDTFCMAVGSSFSGKMYQYNGTQWTDVTANAPVPLYAVSCPTRLFCVAVGESGHTYDYNGTQWSVGSTLITNAQLLGVSCPTSSFCMAVDGLGTAFKYDGNWDAGVPLDSPFTPTLQSVSCPSNSFCMVVDDGGLAYLFDGQSWSNAVIVDKTPNILNAVSCPNSSFCMAVANSNPGLAYSYRN